MDWDQLIWDQGEVTSLEHAACEVGHERSRLKMEVTEHFVGTPSAKKADDVGIDVGAEESVGASSSEAAGSNIGGKESQRGSQECNSGTKAGGYIFGFDQAPSGLEIAAEWCRGISSV